MLEFLQSMALDPTTLGDTTSLLGPLLAVGIAFLVIALIVLIAIYVYLALAFLKIGRKVGLSENIAGLAWVPFLGPTLVSYMASGMHWWPWVVSLGLIVPILNFGVILFFLIMGIIWMWKTFVAVGRPGWWSLIAPIGGGIGIFLGLASSVVGGIVNLIVGIAYLVLVGIAAWGSTQPVAKPAMKLMKPMKK